MAVGAVVGGGVVEVPFLTTKLFVKVDVPDPVTTLTLIVCVPLATVPVSQGLALPAVSVPTKSRGAERSMCRGVPVRAVLSSQKSASVTPDVGVTKT